MDKEKFIKKAKEYQYPNEIIDRMIQDYEKYLKKGIDIDPIIFLISPEESGEDIDYPVCPKCLKQN